MKEKQPSVKHRTTSRFVPNALKFNTTFSQTSEIARRKLTAKTVLEICESNRLFEPYLLYEDEITYTRNNYLRYETAICELREETEQVFEWIPCGDKYIIDWDKRGVYGFFPLSERQFYVFLMYCMYVLAPRATFHELLIMVNDWVNLNTFHSNIKFVEFADELCGELVRTIG